jgi:hypothetical protein
VAPTVTSTVPKGHLPNGNITDRTEWLLAHAVYGAGGWVMMHRTAAAAAPPTPRTSATATPTTNSFLFINRFMCCSSRQ